MPRPAQFDMVFLDHLKPLYTIDLKVMEEEGLVGPVSSLDFDRLAGDSERVQEEERQRGRTSAQRYGRRERWLRPGCTVLTVELDTCRWNPEPKGAGSRLVGMSSFRRGETVVDEACHLGFSGRPDRFPAPFTDMPDGLRLCGLQC